MREQDTRDEEIWKDVPGYEGHYRVSSHGRVKSLPREILRGDVTVTVHGRMMAWWKNNRGYPAVDLYRNGERSKRVVHRLVLEAFVGPCPGSSSTHECRHLDGARDNNHLGNLEWSTISVNQMDRAKHGTSNRGTQHPGNKLTEQQVREIRRSPMSSYQLSKKSGIDASYIRSIRRRKRWGWLED